MGSLAFALGVVGFIQGPLIHSGSRWGSLGSSWDVGITRVHAGVVGFIRGRWVHSSPRWGSLCSLVFAMGVVAWDRWVHSGSRWGSLGSSGVVGFTRVRAGVCWVHPGSLVSLGFALWVVEFALGVVGFMRGRWVQLGSPWESFGSFGDIVFTLIRPGGRWVHPRSLDTLWFALRSLGSSGFVVFTRVCAGTLGSSGIVWFNPVPAGGRWVHPGSLGSLGFALGVVGFALGVVGFMRGRWVHLGSPSGSLGSFGVVGFTLIRPGDRWVNPRSLGSLGSALWFIWRRWNHSVWP